MKKIKRMMAIAIAIILSLGVSNFVFAADTVSLNVKGVAGHSYTAYQLFVGDLSEDDQTHAKTLSNVKWGSDVKTTEITYNTNKTVTPVVGGVVPQDVLDYFGGLNGKSANDNTQETADIISAFISDAASGTGLPAEVSTGYYVIKDTITDTSAAGNSTISTNVVEVVGPTSVQPKASTVTSEKHVDYQNDSDSTDHSELKDSADYDIGDDVPYTLTFTLPTDYASYETYYVSFVDDMSAGLTYSLDGEEYSTELPTGVNAGEYTVYMREGEAEAVSIMVTIAKADVIYTAPVANTSTIIATNEPAEENEAGDENEEPTEGGEEPAYAAVNEEPDEVVFK